MGKVSARRESIAPGRRNQGILTKAPPMQNSALFSASEKSERRFREFFTAHVRNPNTRLAYLAAVRRFAEWCEGRGITLDRVEPVVVAAHVEELSRTLSPASVKQHLAALRMLFDWLVVGQVLPFNPASSVRGPAPCGEWRQDPGAGRQGDPGPAGRDRRLDARRPPRPGLPGRAGLQLRAGERGGLASGGGLLHPRPALVLPSSREGGPVQRGSRPPHGPGSMSMPTSRRQASPRTAAGPCSGARVRVRAMRFSRRASRGMERSR